MHSQQWPIGGFEEILRMYAPERSGIQVRRVHGARDLDTLEPDCP